MEEEKAEVEWEKWEKKEAWLAIQEARKEKKKHLQRNNFPPFTGATVISTRFSPIRSRSIEKIFRPSFFPLSLSLFNVPSFRRRQKMSYDEIWIICARNFSLLHRRKKMNCPNSSIWLPPFRRQRLHQLDGMDSIILMFYIDLGESKLWSKRQWVCGNFSWSSVGFAYFSER